MSNFEFAAALTRVSLAYEIDDQTAHDFRGIAHEAGTIRKFGLAMDHAEIRFMQQCGRTDRNPRTVPQMVLSEPVKFGIERRKKPLFRARGTRLGLGDERGQRLDFHRFTLHRKDISRCMSCFTARFRFKG
ncbi:MAG TPA: hypothetical protein VGD63_01755 [Steroidobacteraceae bacterium]